VAIEELIDDERHSNAFGLMMSLNMLIEFSDAFDCTPEISTDGVGRSIFAGPRWSRYAAPSAAVGYK